MAAEITMPRLSDSMEEGVILRWLVAEGERVKRGQPLVEVETDKANMTYDADLDGTLLRIVVPEGETAALGAPIAVVGEPGEEVAEAPVAEAPVAVAAAATRAPAAANGDTRVKASPVARRMARELGLELAALSGSGPRGRIVKADVQAAAGNGAAAEAPPAPAPSPAPATAPAPKPAEHPREAEPAKGEARVEELSRLQKTISRRMSESRATVPDFELRVDVDMSGCVELRGRLKQIADPAPTYNDMIVKAAAIALREHPRVNASYRDGHFELYSRVNVGVAVAADDALVVPTVFDADRKSLGEIARVTRELAGKVRDGSITPPELSGGTFSVSNLGMFGIDSFSAVINPPQAAILAVGALAKRPAVDEEGQVVARETVPLTLACDHRILYGADGAKVLARVRELLEQPLGLAL